MSENDQSLSIQFPFVEHRVRASWGWMKLRSLIEKVGNVVQPHLIHSGFEISLANLVADQPRAKRHHLQPPLRLKRVWEYFIGREHRTWVSNSVPIRGVECECLAYLRPLWPCLLPAMAIIDQNRPTALEVDPDLQGFSHSALPLQSKCACRPVQYQGSSKPLRSLNTLRYCQW